LSVSEQKLNSKANNNNRRSFTMNFITGGF
jgi:hypothetical protein